MSKLFLTKPKSDDSHLLTKQQNVDFDFKEDVVYELIAHGVPMRPAEVTVIDFKHIMRICIKNKLNARQTAKMMLETVKQAYCRNGKWSYTEN